MNHKVKNIVKKAFSVIFILLIVNLNLNALYQTSLMNPDSSCHSESVEMSCCDMETEEMTELECSLSKWIGTHQIQNCTCLHELNEQSSIIVNTDKTTFSSYVKIISYNNDRSENSKGYLSTCKSENFKYNSTQIYLIDSALLI